MYSLLQISFKVKEFRGLNFMMLTIKGTIAYTLITMRAHKKE